MTAIPEHPTISIIVPAYNEEVYIQRRIENLLGLDYPKDKLEIVIVDDGSIDKTYEIARQYPVKIIRINHSGPAKAKNVGLEHATGELVSIQDANDFTLDKDYLKKIATAYLKSGKNADAIRIKTITYPLSKSPLAQSIFVREHLRSIYLDAKSGTVARVFDGMNDFRKDFLLRVGGYDSRLGAFEDVCLGHKFDQEKPRIIHSDDTTYKAEGGAVTNLSEFTKRHVWRGKAIFRTWMYSKEIFLKYMVYVLYFISLLVSFFATLLGFTPTIVVFALLGLFLIYTLSRAMRAFLLVKLMFLLVMMPFLDFLHALAIFYGVIYGAISKALGRYIPYKAS